MICLLSTLVKDTNVVEFSYFLDIVVEIANKCVLSHRFILFF